MQVDKKYSRVGGLNPLTPSPRYIKSLPAAVRPMCFSTLHDDKILLRF